MARAIDAEELKMFPYSEGSGTEEQIAEWIEQVGLSEDDTASRARDLCWKVIDGFINVVKTQPTLTPPNEWVSVEERLPEANKPVLVYCDGGFAVSYIFDTDMLTGNPVWNYTGLGGDPWYWTTIPTPPDRHPTEEEEREV